MKRIKWNMLYFSLLMVAGAALFGIGIWRGDSNILPSLGAALTAVSIVRLVKYVRILKDPEQVKKFELLQTEERVCYLAGKSRNIVYFATIIAEYIAMLIFFVLGNEEIGSVLSYILCAQVLGQTAVYWYLSKKY